MPCTPSAEAPSVLPVSPSSHLSIIDTGRALAGAPSGTTFDIGDAGDVLSNLDLLEPDLGVMFELKNALTGVDTASFEESFDLLGPIPTVFRKLGDTSDAGDPETLGVDAPRPTSRVVLDLAAGLPFEIVCLSRSIPTSSFSPGPRE